MESFSYNRKDKYGNFHKHGIDIAFALVLCLFLMY